VVTLSHKAIQEHSVGNLVGKQKFLVLEKDPVDPLVKGEYEIKKQFTKLLSTKGEIQIKVKLNKTVFKPGEVALLTLDVNNITRVKPIDFFRVRLWRVMIL